MERTFAASAKILEKPVVQLIAVLPSCLSMTLSDSMITPPDCIISKAQFLSRPIILLLALNSPDLNSGTQAQYMMYPQPLTTAVAQTPTNNISTVDIRNIQAPEEAEYPFSINYFSNKPILQQKHLKFYLNLLNK